jgi:prepilin-type N-terminal cleavage/methylation domain-containing protein
MMPRRSQRGFTLIEVLVAMMLAGVVIGVALGAFNTFQTQAHLDNIRNETQDSARSAIDRLEHDLRNVAAPKATLPGAIERAEPYSIVFQKVDGTGKTASEPGNKNTSNAMRVRYCLDDSNPLNETVWRQEERWTSEAEPPVPPLTNCPEKVEESAERWQTSTKLVPHVTNRVGGQGGPEQPQRHLFQYSPNEAEVGKITAVIATVFVNLSPGKLPGESELTSAVSFRNGNRPPTASCTANLEGTNILLNASESTDPEGLALTYKWWDNGTLLASTSQDPLVKEESAGLHKFKLVVTNPGGLQGESECSFNVP